MVINTGADSTHKENERGVYGVQQTLEVEPHTHTAC